MSRNFKEASEISSMSAHSNHYSLPRMTDEQSFIAVCKGYCVMNMLYLPLQFSNGGWFVGIISINLACLIVLGCALKLI